MTKLAKFWSRVKPALLKFLKTELTKKALAKILGSSVAGGFYGWAISYLVSLGVEKVLEPSIEFLVRKGLLFTDKETGKIAFKKLEKAKDENDEDTYTNIIIDV
jgi:hypothetical protein